MGGSAAAVQKEMQSPKMDRQSLLDLIPAYALGALDPDERAEVESFVSSDAEARRLLAEYQPVVESLVLTVPARRAPAHLGADLRQRLAAERATTPIPAPAARPVPAPVRRPVWLWPAAAAAAFVLVVGAVLLLNRPAPMTAEQMYEQIAALPDALRMPVDPGDGQAVEGELLISPDGKQAVIWVRDMPRLGDDQTFELWLVDEAGPKSGGLIRIAEPDQMNFIMLPLEKSADDYMGFGISIEPAGGSPKQDGPTGPRVFGVAPRA